MTLLSCSLHDSYFILQRLYIFSLPKYCSEMNPIELEWKHLKKAGVLSNTVINDYVKTDDHVHIAHNVEVNWGCFITACSEISGSVRIGEQSWLGPNCSVIDKVTIGAKAFIGIGAVVTKDVSSSVVLAGNPGKIVRDYRINNDR
jgi:acetyltransferase-like isoleucine patch superfamily enzyme